MGNKKRGKRGRGAKRGKPSDATTLRSTITKHVGGSLSSPGVVGVDAAGSQLRLPAISRRPRARVSESEGVLGERCYVHWLLCGDGTIRRGMRFSRGVVYANNILRLKSWDSFWVLVWDDEIFVGLPPEGCVFRGAWRGENLSIMETDLLNVPACPGRKPSACDVRMHYEKYICNWLSEHPGWTLSMCRNGAREARTLQGDQYVTSWGVITYEGVHDCAVAASIDSVHLISGIEKAAYAERLAGQTPKRSVRFETASALFDKLRAKGLKVRLEKVTEGEERSLRRGGYRQSLGWIVSNSSGVFLVILESTDIVHTVAVDSRPDRRVIVDSLERYALSLSVQNLQYCGGGPETQVRALRRVVLED